MECPGVGVSGIGLILDGNVTFSTTTGINGDFVFELVGTCQYTITAPGSDAAYTIDPAGIVVGQSDVLVDLVAVPGPGAGNYLAGNIENNHGQKMGGIRCGA